MTEKVRRYIHVLSREKSDMFKNISCVLQKAGLVKFEDRPAPTIGPEDSTEAIIRIKYVGVCGSDVRLPSAFCLAISAALLTISGPFLVTRWYWQQAGR
jgi:hypothetical protein